MTVIVGTIIGLILFFVLRSKGNTKSLTKSTKNQKDNEAKNDTSTSTRVLSAKETPRLRKPSQRNPCKLRTEEYEACLEAFLKQPEESGTLEGMKTAYQSMVEACPAGQAPLDSSVTGEFEKLVSKVLEKPNGSMSDLKEMEKKLEAVKILVPSYKPIKSLEKQFAEKFGPEFFLSLDRLDKSTEPAEVVKEVKALNRTHPFAKKHHEIDPAAPSHPSLSHESFTEFLKTDIIPKSAEILKVVNTEASKESEQSETTTPVENPNAKYLEVKKSFGASKTTHIKLKDILDFDINEHNSQVQSICKPIEALEAMSKSDLQTFSADQGALADQAERENRYTESKGHKANEAMAKLLLQEKPPTISQSSFDAWKAAGFTAGPEYIDLIRECKNDGSFEALALYSGHLSDFSFKFNHNISGFLKEAFNDSERSLKHYADRKAIPFIYRGITKLRPEHSARFEAAMRASSVEDMRALAREILDCGHYSNDLISNICETSLYDCNLVMNRTARLVMAFGEEVRLYNSRKKLKQKEENIVTAFGVEPDFNAALENNDPSEFVAQFKVCIANGKQARKECANLVDEYKLHYMRLSNLDTMNDSVEKRNLEIRENVLEPAVILLNAQFYLDRNDTPEFLEKLRDHGISSYEAAVKESGKLKLKQLDFELYKMLRLIEKCRDYVRHSSDFAYIKSDFIEVEKCVRTESRSRAYYLVDQVVAELDKPIEVQRCSFDMNSKKLNCNDPKLKEVLVTIYKDKKAAKLLTQHLRNAIGLNSLPEALHIYKSLSKLYQSLEHADYSLLGEISYKRPLWTLAN